MIASGTPLNLPALANAVEQAPCHAARERRVAARDPAQEGCDLLGGLGLQEVAGRSGANRGEQVLLGVRRREHDDLGFGRLLADPRQRREAVHAGHREVEQHDVGPQRRGLRDGIGAVGGAPDDVESLLCEQRRQRVAGEWVVVDDENPLGHAPLIGRSRRADKGEVDVARAQSYRSWLIGEILLVCLLAAGTALFAASDSLSSAYELQDARLVFDTVVAGVAASVCVLTCIRFLVEGRTLDLLLGGGFLSIALGTVVFGILPVLDGGTLTATAAWQYIGARLLGAGLIAVAAFANGRLAARRRALLATGAGVVALLVVGALAAQTRVAMAAPGA